MIAFLRRLAALALLSVGTAGAAGPLIISEPVQSPELGNHRTLRIWLPPSYATSPTRRYPVLYLHDGQNVFEGKTSYSGVSWGVIETAERLIARGEIEEFIAVGIDNTDARRAEYAPCCDARFAPGRLDRFGLFFVRTVKPLVDARYRTRPGAADTAMMGSSFGALAALGIGMDHPDVVGKVGAMSTSFWWGGGLVSKRLGDRRQRLPAWLYVDAGTVDDDLDQTRAAVAALAARGRKPGADFLFHVADGARHHETSWAARLEIPLRFFFGSRRIARPG